MNTQWLKQYPITWSFQDHLNGGSQYPGVDFGMYLQPVYAIESGTCFFLKDGAGALYTWLVAKTGIWSCVHLQSMAGAINTSRFVQEGEQIGISGNTGNANGFHLHLGLFINAKYVDPMPYLNLNNISYNTNMDGQPIYESVRPGEGFTHIALRNGVPNGGLESIAKAWFTNLNLDHPASKRGTLWADDPRYIVGYKTVELPKVDDKKVKELQDQLNKEIQAKKELEAQSLERQEALKKEYLERLETIEKESMKKVAESELALLDARSELKRIQDSKAISLGIDIDDLSVDIIKESTADLGLMGKYGAFIDKHVKSNRLRSILKYDIFVLLGSILGTITIAVLLPNVNGAALAILTAIQGIAYKLLVTNYDRNKDGKLDIQDTQVLQFYSSSNS